MQILDILSPDRARTDVAASSKKRVLEQAAGIVSKALEGIDATEDVFDALLARERLGSTALGEGVAVPHCRLANCTRTLGVLLQLSTGIDFDAPDNRPVDLLFILVVPAEATDEHLQLLGRIATLFNDADTRERLRQARSGNDLIDAVRAFERDNGG